MRYCFLSTAILTAVLFGCQRTEHYYGECDVFVETCCSLNLHNYEFKWNANANIASGESASTEPIYESETGAIDHVIIQLISSFTPSLSSCNCETFPHVIENQCSLQIRTCFNYIISDDVSMDHRQYETWAISAQDANAFGHSCCDYNKSRSIQTAIKDFITKKICIQTSINTTTSPIPNISETPKHLTTITEPQSYVSSTNESKPTNESKSITVPSKPKFRLLYIVLSIMIAIVMLSIFVYCLFKLKHARIKDKNKSISLIQGKEALSKSQTSQLQMTVYDDESHSLSQPVSDHQIVALEIDDEHKYSLLRTQIQEYVQQQPSNQIKELCDKNADEFISNEDDSLHQKQIALCEKIHAYYERIQAANDFHIDIKHLMEILNYYLDILSDKQYETFTCGCDQVEVCTFENLLQVIEEKDIEAIARCQILDKIHFSRSTKSRRMSAERCRRYSQLHHVTDYRAKHFDLGRKFIYPQDDEQKESILVIPKPKFSNLKEELIQNDIVRLTPQQFEIEELKAKCHRDSQWMKKLIKACAGNKKEIPLEYLVALMIYCNFNMLQYEFSKTYREEWKKHHNFFYFAKALSEAVLDFGTSIETGSLKQFFHGVGEVLVPTALLSDLCDGINFYGPLSTSSCLQVAHNFAAGGMVLTLGGSHSDAQYFAVKCLSDYPNEHEYFFIQNRAKIELLNIRLSSDNDEFKVIIQAINRLNAILCQSDYLRSDEIPSYIKEYISHQLSDNRNKHFEFKTNAFQDHKYALQLMRVHFQTKRELTINCPVLNKKYTDLFELFCNKTWIDIKKLMIIFPNIEDITIKGICLSKCVMEDIYGRYRSIFDPNVNDSCKWKLKQMALYVNIEKSELNAWKAIENYDGKITHRNTVQLNIWQQRNIEDKEHHIIIIQSMQEKQ